MPVVRAVLMVCAVASSVSAQAPTGYYQGPSSPLPDSLREVRAGGRFTISIIRTAADAFERQLLHHAEGLFPPRRLIEDAAAEQTELGHIRALTEAANVPGDRWWWREWDGVWLPFALTGAAVTHYVERVRELSAQPNPFAEYHRGVEHSASVEYTARVMPPMTGVTPALFEVQMEVRFSFYCGSLCSLSFTHVRRVTFDPHGSVLRVEGDHPPSYLVS